MLNLLPLWGGIRLLLLSPYLQADTASHPIYKQLMAFPEYKSPQAAFKEIVRLKKANSQLMYDLFQAEGDYRPELFGVSSSLDELFGLFPDKFEQLKCSHIELELMRRFNADTWEDLEPVFKNTWGKAFSQACGYSPYGFD